jgi:hypothetical protein
MKVEFVTDARGTPVAVVVDAAHTAETDLCAVAVDHLPVTLPIPAGTPLIYDGAADSDPLRDRLAKRNLRLVAPHPRTAASPPATTAAPSGNTNAATSSNGPSSGSTTTAAPPSATTSNPPTTKDSSA